MLQDLLLSSSVSLNFSDALAIRGETGMYFTNDLNIWIQTNYPILPNSDFIRSIVRNGETYIAVTNLGYIYYSVDKCVTWNFSYKNSNNELFLSAFYGGGKFIAFGATVSGTVYSSTTGLPGSWVVGNSFGSTTYIRQCIYENNQFIASGGSGKIKLSTDGINWTDRSIPGGGDINTVTYGNGKYIAINNNYTIYSSSDAITWVSSSTTTINNVVKAIYKLGLFVIAGSSGKIQTSPDGITWTNRVSPVPTNKTIYDLKYVNNLFIATTQDGKITTSTDGITWNAAINVCNPYYLLAFC